MSKMIAISVLTTLIVVALIVSITMKLKVSISDDDAPENIYDLYHKRARLEAEIATAESIEAKHELYLEYNKVSNDIIVELLAAGMLDKKINRTLPR